MVEATFELAISKPITVSKTKFNYCVAHIPPEAASVVREIIINPDEEDPNGGNKKMRKIEISGSTKSPHRAIIGADILYHFNLKADLKKLCLFDNDTKLKYNAAFKDAKVVSMKTVCGNDQ
ncbi:hypothetical protein HNY73_021217 [Argiope bruennichi]|uniref:DUF7041 domain-containing protein n=1 Tax=Argiope bruennichi TaxID=94029 RepID=A0A8T0E9G1_ARGBR|nr:hypothetical protein HNY73_021217 [Argiope bruennichi]